MTAVESSSRLAVVLVHPEIPPNTGNVIRLTANTATALHLVEPLGFRMDDRELKRAGLDYHEYASVRVHRDFARVQRRARQRGPAALVRVHDAGAPDRCTRRASSRATSSSSGANRRASRMTLLARFATDARLRIPMRAGVRSLNLSNAVAVAVYEAWRQLGSSAA